MKTGVIAVVQARMGSTRLPRKSLVKIGDWSLVELVLKRIRQSKLVDKVILATSENEIDDILAEHVSNLGFSVFRGSEEDVLSRVYQAAEGFKPDSIIRITGDCPLISPKIISKAIQEFQNRKLDYLSLSIGEDKNYAFPRGFDLEIIQFPALKEAAEMAKDSYEREHVTPYIRKNKKRFKIFFLNPEVQYSRPRYRLCVDTKEDLEVIMRIYEAFQEELMSVDIDAIIEFLDKNPEILEINSKVKQKQLKV